MIEVIKTPEISLNECALCDTIKVTYTLVGEEPVTVEVERNGDGNYYVNGYKIEKDGEQWNVNSSCEKEVIIGTSTYLGVESTGVAVKVDEYNGESVYLTINQNNTRESAVIFTIFFDGTKWIQKSVNGNANVAESTDFITWTSLLEGYEVISATVTTQSIDCVSVNYGETTVELLKVGIFEGQNAYVKGFNPITNYFDYAIGFNYNNILYKDKWVLVVSGVFSGGTVTDIGSTYILPKSPFINPPISDNWSFVNGEDLGSVTTTSCDCGELQATLSEDTPCPFGNFTIEEGSIFESFVVETVNPKDDWYLPAIDELSLLWQNRFNVNRTLSGNSSFGPILGATQIGYNMYWSSTELDATYAWNFNFDSGTATSSKDSLKYVRAVRKFSI